jgi:hypothetical protein
LNILLTAAGGAAAAAWAEVSNWLHSTKLDNVQQPVTKKNQFLDIFGTGNVKTYSGSLSSSSSLTGTSSLTTRQFFPFCLKG